MCCIAEIGMLIWGIVTLVRGEFPLTNGNVVVGGAAYIVGLLLAAPLPIALTIGFTIGFVGVANGNPNVAVDYQLEIAIMELGILLFCLTVALVVAFMNAGPRPSRRGPYDQFQSPNDYGPPKDPNNPYSPPSTNPRDYDDRY